MSFLLDTNAISEPGRLRPDAAFTRWFDALAEEDLFLSAVTVGELRRGACLLPVGARRTALENTHNAILRRLGARVLPVDSAVALVWGELSASHRRLGRTPSVSDELIAATALTWDLTVVTRNTADFGASGCKVLSPWSA